MSTSPDSTDSPASSEGPASAPDSAPASAPGSSPSRASAGTLEAEENLGSVLDASIVYELRLFRHENLPAGLRGLASPVAPSTEDPPATDREIYDLLVFAARTIGPRPDLTLPRTLQAVRLVNLVPENIGAAIFAKFDG